MSNKNTKNEQRRKLLKSAAIGGGIVGASGLRPEKWAKPIVNSVILPTHASTTDSDTSSTEPTLEKFSLVQADPFGPSNAAIGARLAQSSGNPPRGLSDKAATLARAMGEVLLPSAKADSSMRLGQFYLEQLSGDTYRFVLLVTVKIDGRITEVTFLDVELTAGGAPVMSLYSHCSSYGEDSSTHDDGPEPFELISVTPGVSAEVNAYETTFTLFFDPSAVPPSNVGCEENTTTTTTTTTPAPTTTSE